MRLDSPAYKLIHAINVLDFTITYLSDRAEELVKSQNEKDQKMARLWFIVIAELKVEINNLYNELCDNIYEIKLLESQEGKDGLLTEHSGS